MLAGRILHSEVNVSTVWLQTNDTILDTYLFRTYLHEFGHALGLGHTGHYIVDAEYGVDNG